jgi:hypothetical protein
MLRHKRLNEVIATDTFFAGEKSIEGYQCVLKCCLSSEQILRPMMIKAEALKKGSTQK